VSPRLEITPLDAPLGARVEGFSFAEPLDDATRSRLADAVDEHLLLLFRNEAAPALHEVDRFCRAFGPLRPTLADRSRMPGFPGINRVSNRDADGVAGTGGHDIVTWHSDLTFEPPLIEFLYLDAVEVPLGHGNTQWTNLAAAYEALDATTRRRIDGLGVEYRLRDGLDFEGYFKAEGGDAVLGDRTCISLVQTNPRNGRKAVWPNTGPDFEAQVVGLSPAASAELLAQLYAHVSEDRFVYEHVWSEGDSVFWLNNQTLHQRQPFPANTTRVLRHVNILGVADPLQRTCGG